MFKQMTLAIVAACIGSAAIASDVPFDQNEAINPEMVAKIKYTYANDFGQPAGSVVVRFYGDTEALSQDRVALIKAAFLAGS